ncbi:MAG: hypothetical protein EHM40_02750 [Chloroflexi bacterium]|nr:MAG: hypothetical protein EHM40_02750 [Chloroflexota bacterium]
MTTNSQIMGRFLRGETLNEAEIQQIERAFSDFDVQKNFQTGIEKGTAKLPDLQARSLDLDIPITRGICYSFITNGEAVPPGAWRDLQFGGSRARIKESDACVIQMPGYTSRFIRNPAIKADRAIMMLAEVTFPVADVNPSGFNAALDYYEDGVYDASYTATDNYDPQDLDWTTLLVAAHDVIEDTQSVRLSVGHFGGTGIDLTLISANLSFFLA